MKYTKYITKLVFTLFFLLLYKSNDGQNIKNTPQLLQDINPVTPSVFQFLKYTEIPVSLYTGVPQIEIPFYTIKEDGVEIPIKLTYHSGGFRVNEEASWVGLGWDLSFGSLIQSINCVDDFNNAEEGYSGFNKSLPDFGAGHPFSSFPRRYNYPFASDGAGWQNPWPQTTPTKEISFLRTTDYYVPINGEFGTRRNNYFDLNGESYDTEPDVFRANFLGHSINFILDWKTNSFVVLNRAGYLIVRNNDNSWKITDPSGVQYFFELKNATMTNSFSLSFNGGLGGIANKVRTKQWFLTKIITKNKKEISFEYSTSSQKYASFPKYSQGQDRITASSWYRVEDGSHYAFEAYQGSESLLKSAIYYGVDNSTENTITPTAIRFSKGDIQFTTSTRNDVLGGKKLDKVELIDKSFNTVNSLELNYGYMNSSSVGGSSFPIDETIFGTTKNLRLQLLSATQIDGGRYLFTYDDKSLPSKNSFATDYWGYYNGNIANTSFLPNPAMFTQTGLADRTSNGNNHSSNIDFCTAGILKSIIYPTGGMTSFEYELNSFSNFWVPDYGSSTNTISHGCGLRIKTATFNLDNTTLSHKLSYTYDNGISIHPLVNLFRTFQYNYLSYSPPNSKLNSVTDDQINTSAFFSTNMLGSINGVGYGKVTETRVDKSGANAGYIIHNFYNSADIANNSAGGLSQLNASLPAVKDWNNPENGSESSTWIYDKNNQLLKKTEYSYYNILSPSGYYGARIFGYPNLITVNNLDMSALFFAQHLIGYYPLFDFQTQLSKKIETNYTSNGSLAITTDYVYDGYRQISQIKVSNSMNKQNLVSYQYPYNFTGTSFNSLKSQNRLSEVIKTITSPNYLEVTKEFNTLNGDALLENKETVLLKPNSLLPQSTVFDKYDVNSNLQQYTFNNLPTTFLWGYNSQYLVAKIVGATYEQVKTLISQTTLDNISVSDDDLRNEINKIRVGLPLAQVYTYTYKQLVGITSETDPKGLVTTYGYDNAGRLVVIRDNTGNIIKTICYNYAGQQTNCNEIPPFWLNSAQAKRFTKNNCTTGTGSLVTYTVPAGKYKSYISQTDADQKAVDDINSNGQAYANLNGSCDINVNFTINVQTQQLFSGSFYVIVNGVNKTGPRLPPAVGVLDKILFSMPIDNNSTIEIQFLTGFPNLVNIAGYWGKKDAAISNSKAVFTGVNLGTSQTFDLNFR